MHPFSKLLGLAVAAFALFASMTMMGGHPTMLLALEPFVLIVGLSVGGLVASHGPVCVGHLLRVVFTSARVPGTSVDTFRSACRRGQRLAYAAGFLCLLLGVIQVLSVLDHPDLIGPGLAFTLLGLVQSVVVAELLFGNAEHWAEGRATTTA